jgi:hypothetical protein
VTIEDRLRATTEAVTEAMHPVRPLDLRSSAAAAPAPAKYRLPRRRTRWSGWLIPLAAAMAVIAVAATLVAVRSLSAAGPGSPPAPASPLSSGVPRYYVAAGLMGRNGAPTQNAALADVSTGKQLATFSPPKNMFFVYIAAAADDATFVLLAGPLGPPKAGQPAYIWYVLRLSPGAPQRATLTRVPIAALAADTSVIGLAVSPDGRTLAALLQVTSYVGGKKAAAYHLMMRTYSLATGQALRTWSEPDGPLSPTGPGTFNVSWLNDGRTLAFAAATRTAPVSIRFLNTASPGSSLAADSRPVFSPPAASGACSSLLLTADGKVAVCGGGYAAGPRPCAKGKMDVTAYSVATGKLERVLYRYRGGCRPGGSVQVIWAGSGQAAVAAVFVGSAKENRIGLMTPGKFTSLPIVSIGSAYDPGSIAF